MYFFIDSADQTVTAFPKIIPAACCALEKIGIKPELSGDVIKQFWQIYSDRGVIVNLSGAFECIAQSEGKAAIELAEQFKEAVDRLYD